jgi:hypothetical protein
VSGWSLHLGGSEEEKVINQFIALQGGRLQLAASLYRSSSGCTHLYGVISRRSVSLIIRTGGL